MYMTYLRRELAGRKKQTIIVAAGLAIAIALVMIVNSLAAGVSAAQAQALQSVYGVGTDLTVTGAQAEPGQGGGQRFDFGEDGGTTGDDGTTEISQSRLGSTSADAATDDPDRKSLRPTSLRHSSQACSTAPATVGAKCSPTPDARFLPLAMPISSMVTVRPSLRPSASAMMAGARPRGC